ncbi:hypothetical protein HF521_019077, partial [Silurus meridionalis]
MGWNKIGIKGNRGLPKAGESMADPVEPLFHQKVVDKGDDVTLSCSYKEFSGAIYSLQWYREYPKSKPEFLLYITPEEDKSDNIPPRLNATVDDGNKQVDLIISSAAVSDSALYYCDKKIQLHCDSMADLIKPLFTDKAVDEGHDVTLSCSYSGAVTYLHWGVSDLDPIQAGVADPPVVPWKIPVTKSSLYPGLVELESRRPFEAWGMEDPPQGGEADMAEVLQSPSGSVYNPGYLALQGSRWAGPDQEKQNRLCPVFAGGGRSNCLSAMALTGKGFLPISRLSVGDSIADPVEPLFLQKVVDKGDDVTLSCSYKKYSGAINTLQWYRENPKSAPEFLLYITEGGIKSNIPPGLNAKVDRNKKQVDLIISSAAVSDSALYYCAVKPTMTGNPAALYKNL